jgi:hypothetical protein
MEKSADFSVNLCSRKRTADVSTPLGAKSAPNSAQQDSGTTQQAAEKVGVATEAFAAAKAGVHSAAFSA